MARTTKQTAATRDAFKLLFLRAATGGKVHIACDENKARVLRMQLYAFARTVRLSTTEPPDLKQAVDEVMLQVREDGLHAATKSSDPAIQAIFEALGGEDAVAEAAAKREQSTIAPDVKASQGKMLALLEQQEGKIEDAPEPAAEPVKKNPYYTR